MTFGRFMGGLLMVVGGLLTALCGACTLAVIVQSLTTPVGPGNFGSTEAILAVIVGAFGIVPGMALLAVGWALFKKRPQP